MKSSFTKMVKKFERKQKNGKHAFLIVSDSEKAIISWLNEEAALDTLLIYKRNDGKEVLTGFIENNPINGDEPISVLLDLEDSESPDIYFESEHDKKKLEEGLNDLLVIFCEFKDVSFFFYVFNTIDMQIGIKSFNQSKLSNTQFFKHSFLNSLPYHKQSSISSLLLHHEENRFSENNYDEE